MRNCVGFRRFPRLLAPRHETLYRRFLEPIAKSREHPFEILPFCYELIPFDFTRRGRLGVLISREEDDLASVNLWPSGAKRCVFPSLYRILVSS
jgi:hypothetical protein